MNSRDRALAHFKKVDKRFHKAALPHQASLSPELGQKRTTKELFVSLCRTVVSQQLGTAAASTIFARLQKVCKNKITPDSILKARPSALRAAGLSGSKAKTLKEVAKAVKSGAINLPGLAQLSQEAAAEKLTAIWGLGPWSAEMFLMFCVGLPDLFSAGDLGLVRAMEAIYGLPKNTSREKLLKISEKWSPHRTYACLFLWRTRDA